MARPTDWHNLDLHRDPTPGDPSEITRQSKHYKDFVADIAEVRRALKNASNDSVIEEAAGKAMESFKGELGKLPGQLGKLHDSYDRLAGALLKYSGKVNTAQASADSALSKARVLRGDLQKAEARLKTASAEADRTSSARDRVKDPAVGGGPPPPDSAKVREAVRNAKYASEQHSAAEGHVESLEAQLAELKTKAEEAGADHRSATNEFVHDIEAASDAGIQNKKWYQKVADWVDKHWDTIITICKIFVAVVGVILLFCTAGWLLAIFAVAALLVLADTIRKFSQGKAGWGDLLFAVLDCIPVIGRFAMVAKAGKFLGGMSTALKVAKIERSMRGVAKVWRWGGHLKGFQKIGFAFAKAEGKATTKDFLNGGGKEVAKNWKQNLAASAVGASTGAAVDKGFSKVPKLLHNSPLTNWSQRQYGEISMDMAGRGSQQWQSVIGASSGFVDSMAKSTVDSVAFGKDFSAQTLISDTLSGAGNGGVGYSPGLGPARSLR
ncbi:PspA/IM30 family protein [Streptomyces sioyaensis]|uniref:PspA/IM30 family protein n=1 Tax=Streptomyces sioyaensis TaxID=67364 RepID=UPI003794B05F